MNKNDKKRIAELNQLLLTEKRELYKFRIINEINTIKTRYAPNPNSSAPDFSKFSESKLKIIAKLNWHISMLWKIYHEIKSADLKKYIAHLVYKKEEELKPFLSQVGNTESARKPALSNDGLA